MVRNQVLLTPFDRSSTCNAESVGLVGERFRNGSTALQDGPFWYLDRCLKGGLVNLGASGPDHGPYIPCTQ